MCNDIWNVNCGWMSGMSTKSRTQVQLCYKRFKKGRQDIKDDARPGCPNNSTTDENIEARKKKILDNQ